MKRIFQLRLTMNEFVFQMPEKTWAIYTLDESGALISVSKIVVGTKCSLDASS
jgi:hypothetical protein